MKTAENKSKTQNNEYKNFLNKELNDIKADISALAENDKLSNEKATLLKIADDLNALTNK